MTTSVYPPVTKTSYIPKENIRVLLLENVHQTAHEMFRSEGFHFEAVSSALKEDALIEKLRGVHVLGIRSRTKLTARVFQEAKSLLAVGCFCIGTNQVDLDAAKERAVPVFNAPFSNTRSVAELTLCEIIGLARQLGDRSSEVHAGKWRKVATGSYEVRGKTLGIVGYGHIGTQIGVLAEMVGMRVVYFDIASKLPIGNNRPCWSLEELLQMSDFVTLHVPETKMTANMIAEPQLALMKRGSYLLNASRGSVVDIPALAEAIKSGHIAGASVDVYPVEPESNSDGFETPLRGLPNVILTPHVGGSTSEAQASIGTEVATSLVSYLNEGKTTAAVNFPKLELPTMKDTHRILNCHKNVPGVLRDVSKILSDMNANIRGQILGTDAEIGYLIMDLDLNVSDEVRKAVAALEPSIRTRIAY